MSKQTKNKGSMATGGSLLGKVLGGEDVDKVMELPALPSTTGTAATPATTTTVASTTPVTPSINTFSKNATSFQRSTPVVMNADAIAKAEVQKAEEERKANEYNNTLTSRMGSLNSGTSHRQSTYDIYGDVIPSTYSPIAPLPVVPKEIEIPNMVVANESYGESRSDSSGLRGNAPKTSKPGEIYGVSNKGGVYEAQYIPISGYARNSNRDTTGQDAQNSLDKSKTVLPTLFGGGKMPFDRPYKYYTRGANGEMVAQAKETDMGLKDLSINDAVKKVVKNIFLSKTGGRAGLNAFINGGDPNVGAASALIFKPAAVSDTLGGQYQNTLRESIIEGLAYLGLSADHFKNASSTFGKKFYNSNAYKQTRSYASDQNEPQALDQHVTNQAYSIEDAVYDMLLGETNDIQDKKKVGVK